jgi:hemoglobin/transferrin/lactoferrin receptor protein
VKQVFGLWITVLLCTLGTEAAWGSESEAPGITLPEIVVTATRQPETRLSLPYTTDGYQDGDIQLREMSRTTPEILRKTPAVMVQKTGHGQGSPFIRGFTGFRTLFLIDGIRLNNSIFRDGPNQYWNTVDPYSIGRLELVKGPSSVLYGSDAVGGTVNALTISPFSRDVDRAAGGRAYYRYSTAEDSHIARGEGHVIENGSLGLYAGVTYKDFGDLETGDGEQPKTGYEETDFDAKAAYRLSPELRLIVAHQTVDQDDAWRTHKTIYAQSFEGTTVGSELERVLDQNRHLTYARLEGSDLSGFVDDIQVTFSYHRQEEERARVKDDGSSDQQGVDVDTMGAAVEAHSSGALGRWVYGAEYYHDDVASYSRKYTVEGALKSVGVQGPVADDATYDTLGVYVQDTLSLCERFDLIVGARYNRIEADADAFEDPQTGLESSLSKDWDDAVGSVRGLFRLLPDQGVNLFAGVSQGFRAPNLSDLTRLDTARTDEIETPSPDLDPEHFTAYEAGLKAETSRLAFECAYFYTDIEDMIVRTPTGQIIGDNNEVTKRNAGDGYIHGVEVNGSVYLSADWLWWGNLTWMEGEVDTYPTPAPVKVTEPVDRLMPLTANTGLRFQPSGSYWLEGVLTAADEQDRLSTRDAADTQRIPPGGTPSYLVFTLRGSWRVSDALTLTASLENISDENYRVHGSGLNEPGRNLVLAADYLF